MRRCPHRLLNRVRRWPCDPRQQPMCRLQPCQRPRQQQRSGQTPPWPRHPSQGRHRNNSAIKLHRHRLKHRFPRRRYPQPRQRQRQPPRQPIWARQPSQRCAAKPQPSKSVNRLRLVPRAQTNQSATWRLRHNKRGNRAPPQRPRPQQQRQRSPSHPIPPQRSHGHPSHHLHLLLHRHAPLPMRQQRQRLVHQALWALWGQWQNASPAMTATTAAAGRCFRQPR